MARTNYLRNSFRFSGAVLWNSYFQSVRQADLIPDPIQGILNDFCGNK